MLSFTSLRDLLEVITSNKLLNILESARVLREAGRTSGYFHLTRCYEEWLQVA